MSIYSGLMEERDDKPPKPRWADREGARGHHPSCLVVAMEPFVLDVCGDPMAPPTPVPALTDGMEVVRCGGPAVQAGWGGCPLVRGRKCWRLEEAAFVSFRLDLDLAANRALLARYARAGVPMRVITSPAKQVRWAEDLRGLEVLPL